MGMIVRSRKQNNIVIIANPNILEIFGVLSNIFKYLELVDELICFVIIFPKINKDFIKPNPNPEAMLEERSSKIKRSFRLQLIFVIEVKDLIYVVSTFLYIECIR